MSADHFQLVKDNKVENVNMFEVYHPGFPIDFIMTSLEFSNFLFFFCIDIQVFFLKFWHTSPEFQQLLPCPTRIFHWYPTVFFPGIEY